MFSLKQLQKETERTDSTDQEDRLTMSGLKVFGEQAKFDGEERHDGDGDPSDACDDEMDVDDVSDEKGEVGVPDERIEVRDEETMDVCSSKDKIKRLEPCGGRMDVEKAGHEKMQEEKVGERQIDQVREEKDIQLLDEGMDVEKVRADISAVDAKRDQLHGDTNGDICDGEVQKICDEKKLEAENLTHVNDENVYRKGAAKVICLERRDGRMCEKGMNGQELRDEKMDKVCDGTTKTDHVHDEKMDQVFKEKANGCIFPEELDEDKVQNGKEDEELLGELTEKVCDEKLKKDEVLVQESDEEEMDRETCCEQSDRGSCDERRNKNCRQVADVCGRTEEELRRATDVENDVSHDATQIATKGGKGWTVDGSPEHWTDGERKAADADPIEESQEWGEDQSPEEGEDLVTEEIRTDIEKALKFLASPGEDTRPQQQTSPPAMSSFAPSASSSSSAPLLPPNVSAMDTSPPLPAAVSAHPTPVPVLVPVQDMASLPPLPSGSQPALSGTKGGQSVSQEDRSTAQDGAGNGQAKGARPKTGKSPAQKEDPFREFTHIVLAGQWTTPSNPCEKVILGWRRGLTRWKQLTTIPQDFNSTSGITLHEGRIFLTSPLNVSCQSFDLTRREWQRERDVTRIISFGALAVVENEIMRFGGSIVEAMSSETGQWVNMGSLKPRDFNACSVAVEKNKVIILGRARDCRLTALYVAVYDKETKQVSDAEFSPLPLDRVDMTWQMTAPKYVGFVQGAHSFLCASGTMLRFTLDDNRVVQHEPMSVPHMGLRRLFGTFRDGDHVSVFGGRDEMKLRHPYKIENITTDCRQHSKCRYPKFQYETCVWATFQAPDNRSQSQGQGQN